jgi:hypothetical protein
MKLLEALRESEIGIPKNGRVKSHLRYYRGKESVGSKAFCITMFSWFGGRVYNQFLDYSLLAIKVAYIFRDFNYDLYSKIEWKDKKDLVEYLLYDDRHDLWQNAPYILERMEKGLTGTLRKIMSSLIALMWLVLATNP